MTDANGLTLSLGVAVANMHDIKLIVDTLDAFQTGRLGQEYKEEAMQQRCFQG